MTNSPNYCRCHLFLFAPAQSESSLSLPGYHFPLLNPFMPCLWHSYSNKQRHFLWHTWCILMVVHCQLCHWLRLFPASLFFYFHLNVIFCAADSRNLFDLEWQSGIWLSPVFCTWPLLPYSRSNLISWTDRKRRQSLPLLSVSLIPMEHNFIFSQHCFVSHPWLLPPERSWCFSTPNH